MEIVTENGKDYLETVIVKYDDETIDCSQFFKDANIVINDILLKNGLTKIEKDSYGSKLSALVHRFSGTYFSPSFMKSYLTNPATAFLSGLVEEDVRDATSIGTHTHRILELYYKQDKDKRSRDELLQYLDSVPAEIKDQVKKYLEGYIPSMDYLDETKYLDDKELDCVCEYKGKSDIYIPKFDINIPLACSYVVDRIDIRDDKLYIIDYKTGYQTNKSASFDGYLGSMILYKWVVEQDFSLNVAGGYLSTPGNVEKYIPLDFSLVNESKCVEQVIDFCEKFKTDVNNHIYNFTDKGYFSNKELKKFREFMNNGKGSGIYPIKVYLGEHGTKM